MQRIAKHRKLEAQILQASIDRTSPDKLPEMVASEEAAPNARVVVPASPTEDISSPQTMQKFQQNDLAADSVAPVLFYRGVLDLVVRPHRTMLQIGPSFILTPLNNCKRTLMQKLKLDKPPIP